MRNLAVGLKLYNPRRKAPAL